MNFIHSYQIICLSKYIMMSEEYKEKMLKEGEEGVKL